MAGGSARIRRHGAAARWLHGINALAMLLLVGSGLAIGERLPPGWVATLGGHERLNDLHQGLGLALGVAAVALALAVHRRTASWLRELCRFRLHEWRWPLELLRHALGPARHPPPTHDGRLDPLQRLVMLLLLLSAVLVGLAGTGLLLATGAPRWLLALLVRLHVYASWLMLAALGLHVVAGVGILPTHRGIARSMFGDGTVPSGMAERLWPRWLAGQQQAGQDERS